MSDALIMSRERSKVALNMSNVAKKYIASNKEFPAPASLIAIQAQFISFVTAWLEGDATEWDATDYAAYLYWLAEGWELIELAAMLIELKKLTNMED